MARLEVAGGWYHIMNPGHQSGLIFRDLLFQGGCKAILFDADECLLPIHD